MTVLTKHKYNSQFMLVILSIQWHCVWKCTGYSHPLINEFAPLLWSPPHYKTSWFIFIQPFQVSCGKAKNKIILKQILQTGKPCLHVKACFFPPFFLSSSKTTCMASTESFPEQHKLWEIYMASNGRKRTALTYNHIKITQRQVRHGISERILSIFLLLNTGLSCASSTSSV